ncbi:MAG: EAL domain-containing protein [Proteobacteria bacterium]|nr:EAL domain-containing protein [Pseudomonadota bacterium]
MRDRRFALANPLWRRSLKTRVTVFTLAIFLVGIWSLEFYASRMLREDMLRLLGEQQFTTVSLVAREVNDELDDRLLVLKKVAERITPAILDNPAALQTLLEQRLILQGPFNGGVLAYRLDGTAIAELPPSAGRVGINYMDVDTVATAIKEGKTTIGRPVMGKKLGAPIFGMTVPIRDVQGKVIGCLAGVVNLGKASFLDKVTEGQYGKTGGYLLIARQHRLIVTASDKRRIMETLPASGISSWIDRAILGHEGTDIFVNPMGVEVLTSIKGVPAADWIVVVALPTVEVFAPIRAMQERMFLATLFLTLLAGGLTWWMLRRQLSPMLAAVKTLAALSDSDQPPQPLPITRQDEIGELIGGFNGLLKSLALREEALKESEARYRRMMETANEGILSLDADRRITFINARLAATLGYDPGELTGRQFEDFLFPEDLDDHQRQVASRQRGLVGSYERRLRHRDGSELRVQVSATPIIDGNGRYAGSFGMFTDITERCRAQQQLAERELELRTIIETEPECVKQLAADGTLLHMNRAGLEMIEADSLDQVIGQKVQQLVMPEHRNAFMALTQDVFAGESGNLVFEVQGLKGGRRWLHTYAVPLRNSQGLITALLGLTHDISANRQAEVELRIAATAFESQEGIFVTDAAGVILKVNRAFTEITGYSTEEAVGQKSSLTKSGRHDAAYYASMWESIQRDGAWQGEIWNRRKNGEVYPEWLTITAVKGRNGETSHYVSTLTDITARKVAEDEIKHLAFYDPLTRLPNRRLLLDRLQQALASSARSGREGALLFIDLDNFKNLNDTLGHDTGDLLLQQVAQRLSTCIREGDTVARLGGDEFVVMLEDLSENSREAATQTETVGEKILATLNVTYSLAGHEHHSTPSIGATLFNDHAMTVDELLKRADLAMYQAKGAGRNTLRFFDPEMQAVVTARAALEEDLRIGLQAGQFLLYYQVQVSAAGRPTGAEALVRWWHPQRGMVSPVEFIPLAEETGLILPLGHWVLATASAQLVAWAARPDTAHLSLAVNVSARQFHHPDFVEDVLAVLERTGANPHKLKLELTESMLVHDIEDIILKMTALKEIGVRFSLDDFGTGYSSLSYLKRLPLDQLKIDQSFVREVFTDINDGAIAQAIIALSQTMGLSVIAEGVETEEQRDFLSRLGCQSYQGFLFSRPLPLIEFDRLITG